MENIISVNSLRILSGKTSRRNPFVCSTNLKEKLDNSFFAISMSLSMSSYSSDGSPPKKYIEISLSPVNICVCFINSISSPLLYAGLIGRLFFSQSSKTEQYSHFKLQSFVI